MKTKLFIMITGIALSTICAFSNLTFSQDPSSKANASEIEIREIPAQKALVIKAEVLTSEIGLKMGEIFEKLFAYNGKNKIQPDGAPFAVYYTFDPQGKTSFEVGCPIASQIQAGEGVEYKEYPAMKVVAAFYKGAYENMLPIYEELQKYIVDNKLKSKGVSWEVYLTDPKVTKPEDYQTMIYFPIE